MPDCSTCKGFSTATQDLLETRIGEVARGICAAHGRIGQCYPYLAGRPCEHGGWACSFPDDECSPAEVGRRCRPVDGHIAYCIPVRGRFRCVHDGT